MKKRTMETAVGRFLQAVCLAAVFLLVPAGSCSYGADFSYLRLRHIGDIEGSFNQPTEVAAAAGGRIYVLDGANNEVKAFDSRGKPVMAFGGFGTAPGEFDNPVGLDVDAEDNIYVADTGNRRIQVFDRRGNFLRLIELAAMNARPVEVKFDTRSGRLYVSDTENQQIHCFNRDGSSAFSWGGYGKESGEFMYPGMIDVDAAGNIFVVDILNGRVQVFDSSGEHPRQLGRFGIRPGSLFRPKGVLIGNSSRVFVSDSYTGVIQVFDGSGGLVGILSEDGKSPLRLTTPLGMAMNREGNRLYVVQAELNRVSIFELRDGS